MDISSLYSNDIKQLDLLREQVESRIKQYYRDVVTSEDFKEKLLDWAADNLFGLMVVLNAYSNKYEVATNDDSNFDMSFDESFVEELLGKTFAHICDDYRNDNNCSAEFYEDLELCISIDESHYIVLSDCSMEADDNWYYHDLYSYNSEALYIYDTLIKYIKEDPIDFINRCIEQNCLVNMIICCGDINLVNMMKEKGYIRYRQDNKYITEIVKEHKKDIFNLYLESNKLKELMEEDICQFKLKKKKKTNVYSAEKQLTTA